MIMTLEQFLIDVPRLILSVTSVVVVTYNSVVGIKRKEGFFTAGERKISIVCGGLTYAMVKPHMVYAEKAVRMAMISEQLSRTASGSLAILYAGKNHFREMVASAEELALRGVKVALVSCGCDKSVFDNFQRNENISLVLPTHGRCNNGAVDLSRIIAQIPDLSLT